MFEILQQRKFMLYGLTMKRKVDTSFDFWNKLKRRTSRDEYWQTIIENLFFSIRI